MKRWNIGVDIADIARFRRLDFLGSKRFYERVFTAREIEHCLSFNDPAPHFAADYAAKEAVYKAINKFYDAKLNEVEVLRDQTGAPFINLLFDHKAEIKHQTGENPPFEIKVSLSHSALYAVAFVLVSRSEQL